ncbi:hypothetical protein BOX15_Mlig013585g3 [Macrostomum lignano]|uniref:WAP domain-containing protein n=1 Tax=Macrostomum lignano TaxID=282301 RepID=A0A267EPZ7_9PLAT|nr:hypothetical protein BOX15_Mlig013585g3 [Macrostomum lignano]
MNAHAAISVAFACCLPLLIMQLMFHPVAGLKCFKTEVGSTPHEVQCGPLARACRIIIKPYKDQNNSAVTNCNNNQLDGRYLYDCAVECPAKKTDLSWNELDCCSSDRCNTGDDIKKQSNCYVSKGKKSSVYDTIEPCNKPKRCAINLKTQETKCLDEAQCKGGEWKCCKDEECLNKWGVEKVSMGIIEEESTDATSLTPSIAVAITCLLAYKAASMSASP